jgi:rSAM/selenodomain-associated transferase 2/rSAM/selenodomain-associated transferase 1
MTERLIIFTRYPRPGKAKTRLIPALGAEGAATLQRQMTEHTLTQVKNLDPAISVEIWFADAPSEQGQMQDWLGTEWVYRSQGEGDLGDRLITASQTAFAADMERVIIIGTDCPGLDADRLTQAFQALQDHDLVLGDATDGGYYLIGLRRSLPELFKGIDWGTSAVRQQTVAIANQLGLTVTHLPALSDIDYPEDLPVWQAVLKAQRPPISVIIPTLNEAKALQQWENKALFPGELIVVDGGSEDDTIALAKDLGATVITSEPGRATQMNQGAAIAQSDILLFLHADTRLPNHFLELVQQTLAQPQVVAGAFELAIEGKLPGLRWVEWGVNWRSRYLQMPYGDQAIFLTAETFRQLGGFAPLPIMEDFELIKRLQKLGKIAIAPASVITSGRRWQKLGVLKTTLINQIVIAAYYLGISPERISRLYRRR